MARLKQRCVTLALLPLTLAVRFNPSVGLLYSTEGPFQERHADDEILRSQGRAVQPSRQRYGETGMGQ